MQTSQALLMKQLAVKQGTQSRLSGLLSVSRLLGGLSGKPRLVNSFCLGADPEMLFLKPTGARVNAAALGLGIGEFIGADQNQRLAEIRPAPSRSALQVTASILRSMRLLAAIFPASCNLHWLAEPMVENDGLGGHVHFGRFRNTRPAEITSLDALSKALFDLNVFCNDLWQARQRGDQFGQRYGLPGDFRVQAHGYEYRTLPSWLTSPELTFLVLTLSKLTVHDPNLIREWAGVRKISPKHIENLLDFYSGRDDDACMALHMMRKTGIKLPLAVPPPDVKQAWEISNKYGPLEVKLSPTSLPPLPSDTLALARKFLIGESMKDYAEPIVDWKPTALPKNLYRVASEHRESADFTLHLVSPFNLNLALGDGTLFIVPTSLVKTFKANWRAEVKRYLPNAIIKTWGHDERLVIGRKFKTPRGIAATRKLLTCGAFPIASVWNCPANFEVPATKPGYKGAGRVIATER